MEKIKPIVMQKTENLIKKNRVFLHLASLVYQGNNMARKQNVSA